MNILELGVTETEESDPTEGDRCGSCAVFVLISSIASNTQPRERGPVVFVVLEMGKPRHRVGSRWQGQDRSLGWPQALQPDWADVLETHATDFVIRPIALCT